MRASKSTKKLYFRTGTIILTTIILIIMTFATLQAAGKGRASSKIRKDKTAITKQKKRKGPKHNFVGVPPITSMTINPTVPDGEAGWYKTNPMITLTPNETATTYFSWDTTSSYTTYTTPFNVPSDGGHDLNYFSINTASITETPANTATVKLDTTEPTDPSVSSPSHTVDSTTSDDIIDITISGATDTPSGVDGYSFSFTLNTTAVPDSTVDTAPIDYNLPIIAAGGYHSVGLNSDGTVVAAGRNDFGQKNVSGWSNINAIATGHDHTVGLQEDGTVIAVGRSNEGQTSVSGWSNIKAVAGGIYHTVGLQDDGTVVAVGDNTYGQTNVGSWTDIKAIAAGDHHTIGLETSGTVVATGNNWYGQVSDVGSWTGIKAVAGGGWHTIGLEEDGTLLAVGAGAGSVWPHYGQTDVSTWTGMKDIAAGYLHTIGLEEGGTVLSVGNNDYGQTDVSSWSEIAAISGGREHSIGLRENGAAVAVGRNNYGQTDISDWSGIKLPSHTITSPPLSTGTWWFNVRTKDNAGNWTSTAHLGPFIVDTTPPSIPTTPTATPTDTDTIEVSWGASTDTPSGVDYYGVYNTLSDSLVGTTTATSLTVTNLARGDYSYYTMAYDNAGNPSDKSRYAQASVPTQYQWQSISAFGKTYAGNPAGNTASGSFVFNSNSVTLHYAKASIAGTFDVEIDGVPVDTVDAYAPVADPSAQVTYNTSLGGHVITIKPTGFKNGSSSFTWTYIDGYTVDGQKYEETASSYAWQSISAFGKTYAGNPAGNTASGSFSFNSSSVTLHYAKASIAGTFDVEIDGLPVDTVDAYSAVADPLAQVTYATSLGPHVITIKPTGFKNGSSSFTWTYIDGYTVGGVKYEE